MDRVRESPSRLERSPHVRQIVAIQIVGISSKLAIAFATTHSSGVSNGYE